MERTRLVLSRKYGESIRIGDSLVKVERDGGKLKVIVEAPREVRVLRGELADMDGRTEEAAA